MDGQTDVQKGLEIPCIALAYMQSHGKNEAIANFNDHRRRYLQLMPASLRLVL